MYHTVNEGEAVIAAVIHTLPVQQMWCLEPDAFYTTSYTQIAAAY